MRRSIWLLSAALAAAVPASPARAAEQENPVLKEIDAALTEVNRLIVQLSQTRSQSVRRRVTTADEFRASFMKSWAEKCRAGFSVAEVPVSTGARGPFWVEHQELKMCEAINAADLAPCLALTDEVPKGGIHSSRQECMTRSWDLLMAKAVMDGGPGGVASCRAIKMHGFFPNPAAQGEICRLLVSPGRPEQVCASVFAFEKKRPSEREAASCAMIQAMLRDPKVPCVSKRADDFVCAVLEGYRRARFQKNPKLCAGKSHCLAALGLDPNCVRPKERLRESYCAESAESKARAGQASFAQYEIAERAKLVAESDAGRREEKERRDQAEELMGRVFMTLQDFEPKTSKQYERVFQRYTAVRRRLNEQGRKPQPAKRARKSAP